MADTNAVARLNALEEGAKARVENKPRTACPHTQGLEQTWWLKGYDRPHLPSTPIKCATARPKDSYR